MNSANTFENMFGTLRSILAEGEGDHLSSRTPGHSMARVLSLILPWADDHRYREQIVPYCMQSMQNWRFADVPNRQIMGTPQSDHIIALRDKFLQGYPDPLWPMFQTLRLELNACLPTQDVNVNMQDQRCLEDVVILPPNSQLLLLDITTSFDRNFPLEMAPLVESLHSIFSSDRLLHTTAVFWTNYLQEDALGQSLQLAFDNPTLSNLNNLALYDVPLGQEGLEHLVASPYMQNLRYLTLGSYEVECGCGIDDEAFKRLAQSPLFTQLEYLDLSWNDGITVESARFLIDHIDPSTAPEIEFDCTSLSFNDGHDLLYEHWYLMDDEDFS